MLLFTILFTAFVFGLCMVNIKIARGAPSANFDIGGLDASQLGVSNVKLLDSDGIYPRWSPNGTKVLYTVFANRDSQPMYQKIKSRKQIWVMNADGKDKKLLVSDGEYANWSPDAKKIIYRSFRGQTYNLGVYDFPSNKDIRFEIDLASNTAGNMYPYWSNDMNSIMLFYKGFFGIPESVLVETLKIDNLEIKGIRKPAKKISAGEPLPVLPYNLDERVLLRNKAHPIFNVAEVVYHDVNLVTQLRSIPGGPSFKFSYPIWLNKGIWAINKDGSYYNFLIYGGTPQLSPDFKKVIFTKVDRMKSKGIFIGNLEKVPFNNFYELRIGTKGGILQGDLFVIYEKKINPLNNKIIGYHPKRVKGSGVIVECQNSTSLLKVNVRSANIQQGDVAALPQSNIWGILQEANGIEKGDKETFSIIKSRYSIQAITKIRSLKENPNSIEILTQELNSSTASTVAIAAEALGRIGNHQAEQSLIYRLRSLLMNGAFTDAQQSIIWALQQFDTKLKFRSKEGIINIPVRNIFTIKSYGNFRPLKSVIINLKDGGIMDCSLDLAASASKKDRVSGKRPANSAPFIKAGFALFKKGNLGKAIEVTKKAYEIDPKNPYSSYNMACYYSVGGNVDEGIRWLEKAYPLITSSKKYMRLLLNAKIDRDLDNLRKNPEFREKFPKFVK